MLLEGKKREFRSSCPTSWGLRWFGQAAALNGLGVEMDREFGVEEYVKPCRNLSSTPCTHGYMRVAYTNNLNLTWVSLPVVVTEFIHTYT